MKSQKIFTVTDDHIKLLKNAYVGWNECEFGAPSIDCKRPYGNSDVFEDIARILGIKPLIGNDKEKLFDYDKIQYMTQVHLELEVVLQIFLRTGKMKAGTYILERYSRGWRKYVQDDTVV